MIPTWIKVLVIFMVVLAAINSFLGDYAKAAFQVSMAILNVVIWKE